MEQFEELRERVTAQRSRVDAAQADELFSAMQNARVVQNAEEYYRTMYAGSKSS